MPAQCLNDIISVPDCDNEESLSGFSVNDLPGITIKSAAQVASEKFMSGINLIKDAKRRAILQVRNDVVTFLQANGYVPSIARGVWSTLDKRDGSLKAATSLGDYRGIVVKSQQKNCLIRKIHLPAVYVKANYTGSLTLVIEDGEKSYTYAFDSVAGSISKVYVNFTAETDEVYILLPDTVDVYSVTPNCQCGGRSTPKSDCAKVMGYYNGIETKSEGFGIWADVVCKCDYDNLLCYLATNGMLGEIVLYKTGVNIMDESIKTDRLNYFTTYKRDEAEATKAEWSNIYAEKWNTLIQALPNVLPTIDKCGCIDCGSRRMANI